MVLICIGSVFAPIYSTLSTSAKIVLICNCHCYCYPLFLVFLVFFVYPVIFVYPVSFVYWVFFVHCTMRAHCILLNCIPLFLSSMPHWALQRGKSKCVRNNFIFQPKWLAILEVYLKHSCPQLERRFCFKGTKVFVYWRFFVSICRCLFVVMIDRKKPYLNGDPGDGGEKDASIVLGHSSDWQQKIWRWDNKYKQKPGASKYSPSSSLTLFIP